MRKLFLALFSLLMWTSANAQCTPDQTITSDGIHLPPGSYSSNGLDHLPDATLGASYSQTIQILAPDDTVVNGSITADIDSFVLADIYDLPPGFTYACNTSTCQIPGGSHGCGVIQSANVQGSGIYNYKVIVDAYVSVSGQPLPPQRDTLDNYAITVGGLSLIEDEAHIQIFPNPADHGAMLSGLPLGAKEIRVYTSAGELVEIIQTQEREHWIDLQDQPNGLYIVEYENEGVINRQKLVKYDSF